LIKARIRPVLALMALITLASPAAAHADYEKVVGTVTDAHGGTYTIVSHYTDGIVASDPVRLEVRDESGRTVAETQYARDVVLYRAADGTSYAFAVGLDHTFWRGWTIDAGRLVEVPVNPRTLGLALLAHLSDNRLGYGLSSTICVMGIVLYIRRVRKMGTWQAAPPAFCTFAIIWLGLVFMYGNQSFLIVAGLVLAGTLPAVLWNRRPMRRKNQSCGLLNRKE
jgi:hypothetical protein